MSALFLAVSCSMSDSTSYQSRPFFPSKQTKASPGVIGEGRKITKALPDNSHPPQSRFTVRASNGNSCDESGNNTHFQNPQFLRTAHMVVSQPDPYSTVPPTGYQYTRQRSWEQNGLNCAADDMLHDGANMWTTAPPHQVQRRPFGSHLQTRPKQTSIPIAWSEPAVEDCHSDEDDEDTHPRLKAHPNKFPVQIECHDSKYCLYRRQQSRSGYKIVHLNADGDAQQIRYYQKDLVRICKCGKFKSRDAALAQGSDIEENGYEIHYSQKCKWKAYDDFKTGKRVLIRLCKCYPL